MEREKVEMMSALVASGLVRVGKAISSDRESAKRSVRIARGILAEIDAQLPPEKSAGQMIFESFEARQIQKENAEPRE